MKLSLLPKTRPAKWSVSLDIAFVILIFLKMRYHIPLQTFFNATLGLAGFVTGIVAIIKNKDRSILIFIPILVGLVNIL